MIKKNKHFPYAKTKAQTSFVVIAKLISPFNSTLPLLSKLKNFQPLAIFCACTAQFVLDVLKSHIVGFLMTWLN